MRLSDISIAPRQQFAFFLGCEGLLSAVRALFLLLTRDASVPYILALEPAHADHHRLDALIASLLALACACLAVAVNRSHANLTIPVIVTASLPALSVLGDAGYALNGVDVPSVQVLIDLVIVVMAVRILLSLNRARASGDDA